MKRTPVCPDPTLFPEEFRPLLQPGKVFDSSCSRQAQVWFLDVEEGYAPCLPEGLRDSVGVEYFGKIGLNKEETAAFLARVRELRPLGCEELIPRLERAVAEYDGIELF